uniref:Putative ovule protein n=1 Tax=Solanum chacoense TaxID=4108 RepID=A0A0V0GNE4_SOLCH
MIMKTFTSIPVGRGEGEIEPACLILEPFDDAANRNAGVRTITMRVKGKALWPNSASDYSDYFNKPSIY